MKKIVITGGAGFVGSHIVDEIVAVYRDSKIIVLDKMTYAADVTNVMHHITNNRIRLMVGDICDLNTCAEAVKGADLVIHAAAESHVDNSFGNSLPFSQTNVLGTHTLMEACRMHGVPKIIHFSTDEVYGEIKVGEASETHMLKPTNPYSASKAAAEMIIQGYLQSFKLPVVIIRANNIYGIRQFPEKIIPKFLLLMMQGEKLTLHGNGKNSRHFVAAQDIARAVTLLIDKGVIGEIYNIGSEQEYENIQVAHQICALFNVSPEQYITYIDDRPFNDARYAVNWDRIKSLGWSTKNQVMDDLPKMAQWYMEQFERFTGHKNIILKPKA